MTSNIGICGAHRTGKTTLAKAVSEATGIPYVPISTSQVFKDNGLDPSDKLDIWTRFDIQKKILLHACDIWFDMDQQFICDRTPLDMLGYTLADIQANSIDVISEEDIAAYSNRCFAATRQFFSDQVKERVRGSLNIQHRVCSNQKPCYYQNSWIQQIAPFWTNGAT